MGTSISQANTSRSLASLASTQQRFGEAAAHLRAAQSIYERFGLHDRLDAVRASLVQVEDSAAGLDSAALTA